MADQRRSGKAGAEARRRLWKESHSLLVVVLVCGAVLMAFEMVGFRILSPTFGTTTFVVGSVISIFLGALSLGYLAGGRLADRVPSFFLLGVIIAAAGLIIVTVPLYAPAGCRWISERNPHGHANPLLASLLLFLVPSVLLGTVSPFAVRLQARSVQTVGNVAGKLYALSTLGSIAGTLAATFWLIPTYRVSSISKGLGLCLIAVSLLAIVPRLVRQLAAGRGGGTVGTVGACLIAGCLSMIPSPSFIPLRDKELLVEEEDSAYQHIGVVLVPHNYDGLGDSWALRLQFDEYVESEIDVQGGDPTNIQLKQPYTSNAKYTDMLHLPFLFNPDAREVLIVGGGGGVAPTIFKRDYPQVHCDIVEIDPVVLGVSQRYFHFVPDDERTTTHVMDGRVYVRDYCKKKYDIVVLDAFTGGRPPFHLLTREFLELLKTRLSPRGVVHLNIISSLDGERGRLYRAVLKTFLAVFGRDHVYVFPKWYDPRWGSNYNRTDGINIELVATNYDTIPNPLPRETIARQADEMAADGRMKIPSILIHARNYQPAERDRDLSGSPILTDDYAPVENWVTD